MIERDDKRTVLTKLRTACNGLEDALSLTAAPSLHDPVILPEAIRKELSVMVDDLNRILLQLNIM